nr:Gfo/Idh/MocA family oxidoreductase [Paracoccus sp. Z118]
MRAGIAGLGRWGQTLVDASRRNPDSMLSFVRAATRSPDKAAAFCADRDLPLAAGFDALLVDDDIEAVVLATPHSQHADQIRRAAAAGRHVFVEKPLALTLADAISAVDACETAGVRLAVGFNRRFLPAFRALQGLLASGDLGRPLHVEGSFCGPFGYQYTDEMWRGSAAENPAGGMAAMGIHVLDAMIAIMGPVVRVAAISRRLAVSSNLDDTTVIMLEFASGATGSLSTLMATAPFWRLHVFGASGWAQMPDQARLIHAGLDGQVSEQSFEPLDTLATELDAFALTVREEWPWPVTTVQALASVGAMEAIARSAAGGGNWVGVEER